MLSKQPFISLERDLLSIDGVTSVEFDLNGFLDDIHQVIVLVGYDFHIVTRKLRLAVDVVNTACLHGLEESGDRIEDYGEHLYLVFNCGQSWSEIFRPVSKSEEGVSPSTAHTGWSLDFTLALMTLTISRIACFCAR